MTIVSEEKQEEEKQQPDHCCMCNAVGVAACWDHGDLGPWEDSK